jgi:hypothetical protein
MGFEPVGWLCRFGRALGRAAGDGGECASIGAAVESGVGQREIAVLGALAAVDMDHHAQAIDIGDFEMECFVKAQAAGVDGGEVDVVVEGFDVFNRSFSYCELSGYVITM